MQAGVEAQQHLRVVLAVAVHHPQHLARGRAPAGDHRRAQATLAAPAHQLHIGLGRLHRQYGVGGAIVGGIVDHDQFVRQTGQDRARLA
jgi:hypothetical protein